jgi:hypothetical protein
MASSTKLLYYNKKGSVYEVETLREEKWKLISRLNKARLDGKQFNFGFLARISLLHNRILKK